MYRMYKEDDGCWECQQNKFKKGGAKGSDKKWIQKAVKGMRKDKPCTGSKFGGPSCPPGTKRYNLAKVFREMAAKKKKEMGGQSAPMNMAQNIGQDNINYFTSTLKDNASQVMQDQMLNQVAQQEMMMPYFNNGGPNNIFGYSKKSTDPNAIYYQNALRENQANKFDFGNYLFDAASQLQKDIDWANTYNKMYGPELKQKQTSKLSKEFRRDLRSDNEEISDWAKTWRKEQWRPTVRKNRKAQAKIFWDKLNPFTPNPEIPQVNTNTQVQQNQYGGTINYNDMNFNGYYGMPMYNQGGMKNYVYQGQDTGMTAEEFYQYQLETEGPFILPDGTDTGMSKAEFMDMQSQQMPEMQQMDDGGSKKQSFSEYYANKPNLSQRFNKLWGSSNSPNFEFSLDTDGDGMVSQEELRAATGNYKYNTGDPFGYSFLKNYFFPPATNGLYRPQSSQQAATSTSSSDYPLIDGKEMTESQKKNHDRMIAGGFEFDPATGSYQQTSPKKQTQTKNTKQKNTTNTQTEEVDENVASVENTAELLENNTTGTSDGAAGVDAGASDGAVSSDAGASDAVVADNATGTNNNITPVYAPSPQIGYAGVPVLQGQFIMPGRTTRNSYVPGGYGLAPIAYNAAGTYLDEYNSVSRAGGLRGFFKGRENEYNLKFKHNMLTDDQKNQLFQIEMRRRGYNPDGTSISGGTGSSADAEKAATDAAAVVDQVSKDEAKKAVAERTAQGLPPNTNPTSKLGQEPNFPIDLSMMNQEAANTVDELVQEQNNPNTTGNNRNVITGQSNTNKLSVGMQKADPTGMGTPPADYQPVPTYSTTPIKTLTPEPLVSATPETPITESELDIDYSKIPIDESPTVTGNKPTPEEEDARVQEQINMAENKGFYGGGTVRRKSYMNGGNVQLQALHNEMQALTARQNEIRNLINNQMFNSGQSQLPTQMQQPMPMQQPMQQPVARFGYQVKNGNLMNSYAKGGSFNNPGFMSLPDSVQQKIMTASQNKMAMGGAYDYYGGGGSHMDYNEGGEYYLSDDEIQAFLEAGGQLEIME